METIELKIRRIDFGGENQLLENRVYEALRKSGLPCSRGEWNQNGRKYTIKGLHNLARTAGMGVKFENGVEEDLKEYEKRIRTKARQ